MSATSLLTLPTNRVVARGVKDVSYFSIKRKVETATSMLPGALVIKGTNNDDITVAGDEQLSVLGVLGFEGADGDDQPDTITTLYAANAWAPVLMGNFIGRGIIASSETIVPGDKLVPAASGELKKEAHDTTATVNQSTVNTAISEGISVVAKALDSSSGGEAITVLWML